MVRVNRTQFPSALRREAWQKFWKIVRSSPSPEVLARDLSAFFSPSEIAVLEKRLAILLLLEKGAAYREIGRTI